MTIAKEVVHSAASSLSEETSPFGFWKVILFLHLTDEISL